MSIPESQQKKFLSEIVPLIQKWAPHYGIKVVSPIIAQAIDESAWGTHQPKVKYYNFFGLKYRPNRLDCNDGYFMDTGSEQNPNGTYTKLPDNTAWYAFDSMDMGVKGYFEFINTPNYANLKGVTVPLTYIANIKKDQYATSHDYVATLMNIITRENLTQYDTFTASSVPSNTANSISCNVSKVINVHAGHNAKGHPATGAVGLINESVEDRLVKDKLILLLRGAGYTVYDCTVDGAASQAANLQQIVQLCNEHAAILDISIHFNAGARDMNGNKLTTGTEAWIYSSGSKAKTAAQAVVNSISRLGYKNRGIKYSQNLYVLKRTKSPAMLIECCFVDDKDDVMRYSADTMAAAIFNGIKAGIGG